MNDKCSLVTCCDFELPFKTIKTRQYILKKKKKKKCRSFRNLKIELLNLYGLWISAVCTDGITNFGLTPFPQNYKLI